MIFSGVRPATCRNAGGSTSSIVPTTWGALKRNLIQTDIVPAVIMHQKLAPFFGIEAVVVP